jgi:Sulfotransferase family
MRFIFLHYHFLKNAGTTIENILDRNFGERFERIDTSDRSGHFNNDALLSLLERKPEIRAVSSHQIRHPLPQARGYLFFDICFLRDPIDRIRSMYDYFRQKPSAGDPLSELANRAGLREFLTCLVERFREEATNVQVALLAKGGVDEQPPDERDFQLALERMLETSFLGVVDRFEDSLTAGRHYVEAVFPNLDCTEVPANVSGGMEGSVAARRKKVRQTCGDKVYAELLRRNELDSELVRRARAEVRRRLGLVRQADGCGKAKPHCGWRAFPSMRIRRAGLFDAAFYLERYPDVRRAGIEPLRHYMRHGAAEGRKPHPLFEPDYYLACCPEARHSRNPLVHFLDEAPWCSPHPLFDCASYVAANPDAATQPLAHYLRAKPRRDCDPADGWLKILDVPVAVNFRERPSPAGTYQGGPVLVWKDADGRKQFLAPPEQQPFFRALGYGQLHAQVEA